MALNLLGRPTPQSILALGEIVELVLSFLPARDLANALQVCRLWREMGKRVFRFRKSTWASFVVHHGNNTPCSSKVGESYFNKYNFKGFFGL